jgi:SM-20-related protein
LDESFDALINSYVDDQLGTTQHFLPANLATALLHHMLELHASGGFAAAGTGNGSKLRHDEAVRSDSIYWLDPAHVTPDEATFLKLIDRFVEYLNATCYTGITGYEFHYALYGPGSFYKRHRDAFQNDNARKFSMIMYLTDGWQEGDGGELFTYPNSGPSQKIAPQNGNTVFFKSNELEHEVLLTHKPRMSITGWLKG